MLLVPCRILICYTLITHFLHFQGYLGRHKGRKRISNCIRIEISYSMRVRMSKARGINTAYYYLSNPRETQTSFFVWNASTNVQTHCIIGNDISLL